jgi:hypothetical protein
MVFNSTRIAQLPFSNGQLHAHTKIMKGKGLGTGMDKVREKLQKLSVEQPSITKPKVRKIQMSM